MRPAPMGLSSPWPFSIFEPLFLQFACRFTTWRKSVSLMTLECALCSACRSHTEIASSGDPQMIISRSVRCVLMTPIQTSCSQGSSLDCDIHSNSDTPGKYLDGLGVCRTEAGPRKG